jgi:hypothetical protein
MKSLFFLYGEYRTFPTAVKTWNILDIPNLQIVIHTPNTSSNHIYQKNYKKISENDFLILKNKKIYFYDREDYLKTDLHVLHFSYRFLSKYLNEISNDEYDYIFIGRLDSTFYIEHYNKLLNEKRDELFALSVPYSIPNHSFIPDHAFFGSYQTIKKFVDKLPPTKNLTNSHTDMGIYVHENFSCSLWDFSWETQHIRDNMIPYFEKYLEKSGKLKEYDKSYLDFIEWFDKNYRLILDDGYKKSYKSE